MTISAQDVRADSVVVPAIVPGIQVDTVKPSNNVFSRVVRYFSESNKVHREKPFDVTFIGGPHYSIEKQFGIGILAAGVYSTARMDTLTPFSNVSLYADVSTSGFYTVGIKGTTRFPRDKYRFEFDASFESMPDFFWGIGYDYNCDNDNKTKFKQLTSEVIANFQIRVYDGLYVGPVMDISYMRGSTHHHDMLYLWQGEKMSVFNMGVGARISYDTRDNLTATRHGVYAYVTQRYYGKWMGNTYPFQSTELQASWYAPTWKNCSVAIMYHTKVTYGDTPWCMLAQMGGGSNMRGYYSGRYRDKGEMDMAVELRQKVYRRIGAVVWGGAGTVFPRIADIKVRKILPNYGVGLRWEFKKNVNLRGDIGIGKGEWGFVFNINEAF